MKKIFKNKKIQIFVLVYLTIFTSYFSIITLSKYSGRINGSGQMTIAKWDVSLASNDDSVSVLSGSNGTTYNLNVVSASDVGIDYYITINNIPTGVAVLLDGVEATVNAGVAEFGKVGSIYANDSNKTKTHTLTFKAPLGTNSVTNRAVGIDVKFVQIN